MRQDKAIEWVAALRSGKFEQARGQLKKDGAYCCLGVACVVAGYEFDEHNVIQIENESYSGILPKKLRKDWKIESPSGGFCYGAYSLAELNDMGKSFDHIADVIEQNWEKL